MTGSPDRKEVPGAAAESPAEERQAELARLAELVDGFEQRQGRPVSSDLVAEAEAAWHDE